MSQVATRVGVCSVDSLAGALAQWNPDAVVSVFSPSSRLQVRQFKRCRHLVLLFHDIEVGVMHSSTSLALRRSVGCSERHIHRFIEFLEDKPERLLIHCVAGLSRSPALAILAICLIHGDVTKACIALKRAIPQASPNRRVLRLGDEILKLDGRLIEQAAVSFPDRQMKHERIDFVELDFRVISQAEQ